MRSTRTYRTAVGVVVAAAACGPASLAAAKPFELNANGSYVTTTSTRTIVEKTAPCSEVCSGGGYSSPSSVLARSAGVHAVHPTGASSQQGFRWDDAGIGAAGMLVLISTGVAAIFATRRQRLRITAR